MSDVSNFVDIEDIGHGQSFLVFYTEDGTRFETPPMDIWRAAKVVEAVEHALIGWEGWTR